MYACAQVFRRSRSTTRTSGAKSSFPPFWFCGNRFCPAPFRAIFARPRADSRALLSHKTIPSVILAFLSRPADKEKPGLRPLESPTSLSKYSTELSIGPAHSVATVTACPFPPRPLMKTRHRSALAPSQSLNKLPRGGSAVVGSLREEGFFFLDFFAKP